MHKLFGRPGWGSVLVEAQLAWYGLAYETEDVEDLFASAQAREKLAAVNPLAQVPTLILPNGQVMTESAAITLHLADITGLRRVVAALTASTAGRPKTAIADNSSRTNSAFRVAVFDGQILAFDVAVFVPG